MSHFQFITEWSFDTSIDSVWAWLTEPERFPSWWPGFEKAKLISGEKGEIGSIIQYRVRGDLGLVFDFTMTLERMQKPKYLFLRAAGDFIGTGEWRIQQKENHTHVIYTWEVEVQRWWLRFLSRLPGARKYLQRSHDRVMTTGGANLAKLLAQGS